MTELPIDTLIIIGLVIASFVGKFFQKKEGEKSIKIRKKVPFPKKYHKIFLYELNLIYF